jgi:hypothetical protein
MGMNYLDVHYFLEQLFRYRTISKHILSLLSTEHRLKALSLLRWCTDNGIVEEIDDRIKLVKPVELLISLQAFGIAPDRFNLYIAWHEFEQYISRIFAEFNWYVYLNYVHTKADRFQIDVISINDVLKLALFIECKRWKSLSKIRYSINKIVEDHIKRIEKYMRNCEWVCIKIPKLRSVKNILPVVIIPIDFDPKVLDGVPIISIFKLHDFVVNIDVYIDSLNLKLYRNRCYIDVT